MSFSNRDNPYTFDSFLNWRSNFDFYSDDHFIQTIVRHFSGTDWPAVDDEIRSFSPKVSFRWRDFAERAARPENRPYLLHYDAHNHRIDRIVLSMETQTMAEEVFQEALFRKTCNPWVRLAKMLLIYQNGESCVACPLTCTEGLVATLEAFADTPETLQILEHCREGYNGDFAVGSQYLTEIQGGSDVPANMLEAVEDGDFYRLYGTKFFCSVPHADYAIVTAKPVGSQKIGIFVVPSWLPGDKEKEIRNGCTIHRLKWKMGTTELPTAEMSFHGAVAYPLGSLDRGLANVVGIVLTYSRLTVGLSGAATMTRAAREATQYSNFRDAFGVKIGSLPMVAAQITRLQKNARRSTAAAFKIYKRFLELDGKVKVSLNMKEPQQLRKKRFDVRELVMLQKITCSWDAVDQLRTACSIFGGNGVIEDFSALPRLYRDATVNELWEGPRNVLLSQIHRDLQQASPWYQPAAFVNSLLDGAGSSIKAEFIQEIEEIVAHPNLTENDDTTLEMCTKWDHLCHRLFHAYQDQALREVSEGVK
jgi:alkylation response protein AidB-like acyl-CoA dehydrogenase